MQLSSTQSIRLMPLKFLGLQIAVYATVPDSPSPGVWYEISMSEKSIALSSNYYLNPNSYGIML